MHVCKQKATTKITKKGLVDDTPDYVDDSKSWTNDLNSWNKACCSSVLKYESQLE